jgi:hypothetical protein
MAEEAKGAVPFAWCSRADLPGSGRPNRHALRQTHRRGASVSRRDGRDRFPRVTASRVAGTIPLLGSRGV